MITPDFMSFVEASNQASNVDCLFELFSQLMDQQGYDRLLLALMTDHPQLKKEAEHGILKSYPESWVKHYLEQGYDLIDPIRTSAFSKTGAFTWQEIIESNELTRKQQRMFSEAKEVGLLGGIGVSLRGSHGAVGAIGAASSVADIKVNIHQLDLINLLSQQFYTCFCRLMEKQADVRLVKLSEKEQEILKWCARGLTKAEIGDKLCISLHTVDFHVRNSFQKLHARNITAAVVQAINLGLIQI